MRGLPAAVALAAALVAGCGGSGPQHAPATTGQPSPTAAAPSPAATTQGQAFCARLTAAPDVRAAYLDAVIRQELAISAFSSGDAATEKAARAQVAGWIAVWCPRYAYLTRNG